MQRQHLRISVRLDDLGRYVFVWRWLEVQIESVSTDPSAPRLRITSHPMARLLRASLN